MGSETLTPWHVSFGLRLRRARKQARYSTRQVAKLIEQRFQLGLSHGSIARIERGEQRLSVGMLAVLCSIYEVPPIEVAIGLEARDDAIWHTLVRAGLKEDVVAGVVWLEQMLDHGYAKLRPEGTSPPTAAAD